MSTALNGYGIRPAYSPQHNAAPRTYPNGIASGYATGILKYQPVSLNSAGQIVAATANSDWLGVFAGVKYVDLSGIPHSYDQWIAGTVYTNNGISAGITVLKLAYGMTQTWCLLFRPTVRWLRVLAVR